MAITYITGIPRSGKSYYAMFLLYMYFIFIEPITPLSKLKNKLFPPKPKKSYDIAYTNINQFDFTKSDKIKFYDHQKTYDILAILHEEYLNKKTDDYLIKLATENGLYNALFVIDEAQNFFDKDDKVLTWWITYHGHLHQDLIFITQNLELINSKYTKQAEFFYKAVPPSSRIFSNKFRYVQFNSVKLYQKDKIGDFHVPMVKEIFDMYVSGAENNSKSHVKKYLGYFVALFILLIIVFKSFTSTFDTSKNETVTQQDKNISASVATDPIHKQHELKKQTIINEDVNDTKLMLFDIKCVDMLCNYNDVDFPKPLLNKIMKKTPPEFQWFFTNGSYIQYFVMLPNDTFDFLPEPKQKDKKDAKSTPNEKNTSHNPITKLVSK